MQLMTWNLSRLGGRFNLLFEPYRRRVMHSAMGRFLDQPLNLEVGLIEPDGTARVLPFCEEGELLHNCEQFERVNSITYRGYSEKYRLKFEFNIHAVFWPQDESTCTLPAFFLEMRLNPADRVRWIRSKGERPDHVKLFLRLARPDTKIETGKTQPIEDWDELPQIAMSYQASTRPQLNLPDMFRSTETAEWQVQAEERIVSLNPEATVDDTGRGLEIELPVTDVGSGIKWRLVWGAHVSDPVLKVGISGKPQEAGFRYASHWPDVDAVIASAMAERDAMLAKSRRFEKLIDGAALTASQRHLMTQSFQSFLSNTWWVDLPNGEDWFVSWEGSCYYHSTIDVEYNIAPLYLTVWPDLLAKQLRQWPFGEKLHERSGGSFLSHDLGQGSEVTGQRYPHEMEVEENSNYLLMLQAYTRWTGDKTVVHEQADLVERLATYLQWTDVDGSGFPSEGTANTIDDASPAMQYSKKQTYLAVKRLAALKAAGDLLALADRESEKDFDSQVAGDAEKIMQAAWLGDHFAVCADKSAAGVMDAWTGRPLPYETLEGWDAYSIYTANGLLLPLMTGQPGFLPVDRVRKDVTNATRETMARYGCGHSSFESENLWVSQNIWRDCVGQYLNMDWPWLLAQRYWDMQVMSNTHAQSYGFVDTYVTNSLCFYPRGAVSFLYLLAQPRLVVDRLAAGGPRVTIDPPRNMPQRWPLLALADWKAGKVPVCVVDSEGEVSVENETDPIVMLGSETEESGIIA